jgi:hypothetical protein
LQKEKEKTIKEKNIWINSIIKWVI